MIELLPFLKELISAPGLSGYEAPVRKIITKAWQPLTDELITSPLGSLHGLRRAQRDTDNAPPSILYAAHMDAIGLMVTSIVDGWLHITEIGGVDPRVLPGQPVIVHGRDDLPGLVVQPPAHLLPNKYREKPVPLNHLLVETGLLPAEVERLVRVGDLVSFAQPPIEMDGDTLAGHTLDNRALRSSCHRLPAGAARPKAGLGCLGCGDHSGGRNAGRSADIGVCPAPQPGCGDRRDFRQQPGQPRAPDLPNG